MSKTVQFRNDVPQRTYAGVRFTQYRKYKPFLRNDFRMRCGYCNSEDFWFGGPNAFHIDHFAPKSKFPLLQTRYSNLVYACPYCNRAKSNDWPSDKSNICVVGNKGYLDPCSTEYDNQLCRDEVGRIIPTTELGKYIHKKLKLYLERKRIIWTLDRIYATIEIVNKKIENDKTEDISQEVKDAFFELSRVFFKYLGYLKTEPS